MAKRTEPHNPDYKLIGKTIGTKNGYTELVYGISNNGDNAGLEVYFYRDGADHFYHSRRWPCGKIPPKYQDEVLWLMSFINECPEGHKLYLN